MILGRALCAEWRVPARRRVSFDSAMIDELVKLGAVLYPQSEVTQPLFVWRRGIVRPLWHSWMLIQAEQGLTRLNDGEWCQNSNQGKTTWKIGVLE